MENIDTKNDITSTDDDITSTDDSKNLNKILIYGLILFIVGIVIIITIYTSQQKSNQPDEPSKQRIQQLNEILSSYFGPNWYIILSLLIILIILLICVFITQISIGPFTTDNKAIKWSIIVATLLIVLGIVELSIHLFMKNPNLSDPNYDPYNDYNKKKKAIMIIVAACILLVFGVFIGIGFIFKK